MRPFARCWPEPAGGLWRLPLRLLKIPAFCLLLLLMASTGFAAQITDYLPVRFVVADAAGKLRVAIRSFHSEGVPHLLVVDPVTLKSYDLPASAFTPSGSSVDATPYLATLRRFGSGPFRLQNDGATHALTAADGVFLTVDLCPSRRPFEREMFQAVEALGKGAPVPVAISISGIWLVKHPEELSYLQRESAGGRLAITWVNHSYHHPYQPGVPLERNFVLTPGTDFTAEVLELERELLAHGLVPSPFFRFPGLVSDRAAITRLTELSLIPLGADAWLAKGEHPRRGSFILVHGNGNEPKGVKLLMPMLRNKELHLLPLPAAFVKEP